MAITNTSKESLAVYLPLRRPEWLSRIVLLSIFLLSITAIAISQPQPTRPSSERQNIQAPKRFYLKLNPIPILHGPIPNTSEYRIGFEVVGAERFSYQILGSYLNKSLLINALSDDSIQNLAREFEFPGFRFQLQARYYLMKLSEETVRERMIPSGIYTALHLSYATATFKPKAQNLPKQDWTNITANVLLGTQLMVDDDLGIDVFFGLGFKQNRAFITDSRQRVAEIDIAEEYGGFLGSYLASPVKVSFGFHMTFGLL